MSTKPYITNMGTKMYISDDSNNPTFSEVKRLRSVPGLALEQEKIEVTHNGSKNREFIKSGLSDPGDYEFEMETDFSDLTHKEIFSLRDTDEVRTWRIVYPDGLAWEFQACVLSITRADYDTQSPDVIVDTVALAINGEITDISDDLLS